MKLSNTKTKSVLESVTIELTPREFDIILTALGSCTVGEVMKKINVENDEIMRAYYALKSIAGDIKEHR